MESSLLAGSLDIQPQGMPHGDICRMITEISISRGAVHLVLYSDRQKLALAIPLIVKFANLN